MTNPERVALDLVTDAIDNISYKDTVDLFEDKYGIVASDNDLIATFDCIIDLLGVVLSHGNRS